MTTSHLIYGPFLTRDSHNINPLSLSNDVHHRGRKGRQHVQEERQFAVENHVVKTHYYFLNKLPRRRWPTPQFLITLYIPTLLWTYIISYMATMNFNIAAHTLWCGSQGMYVYVFEKLKSKPMPPWVDFSIRRAICPLERVSTHWYLCPEYEKCHPVDFWPAFGNKCVMAFNEIIKCHGYVL